VLGFGGLVGSWVIRGLVYWLIRTLGDWGIGKLVLVDGRENLVYSPINVVMTLF
jgi:hypothetical protein